MPAVASITTIGANCGIRTRISEAFKSLILFGIRSVTAYAYHAAMLGYKEEPIHKLLYKALFAIGMDDWGMGKLLPIVLAIAEGTDNFGAFFIVGVNQDTVSTGRKELYPFRKKHCVLT